MPKIDYCPQDYPSCPGTYLIKDEHGRILYVGKAANLRKRVASYFRDDKQLSPKTKVMMDKVQAIDYLCTSTEKEALLLESSLIKKHKPRYNIVLRDDKSYILFKLEKESKYPRLYLTRQVEKDGSVYFGPFTSALAARETMQFIHKTFPLRKCSDRTFSHRTRPCLQYYIGRCLAPCVHHVDKDKYNQLVSQVELFLKGKSKELLQQLEKEMYESSKQLDFEHAACLRDKIRFISQTIEQQTVVFPEGGEKDIIGLANTEQGLNLGVIFVRQGKVIDQKHFFWPFISQGQEGLTSEINKKTNELALQTDQNESQFQAKDPGIKQETSNEIEGQEFLRNFFIQFYAPGRFIPKEIILLSRFTDPVVEEILSERRQGQVRIKTARSREEKRLVALAQTNALEARQERNSPLTKLTKVLNLPSKPIRIEAVDASHLSGQGMLVGQIVCLDEELQKDLYRIYSFPELEGSRDDYAALAKWVKRRVDSGPPWPDMVLIDGGKGHLAKLESALNDSSFWTSQTQQALGDSQNGKPWELVAIAKGARRKGELEEFIYRPHQKNPVHLQPGSQELLFLQYLRDNVHRFVISRQRQDRKKHMHQGGLESLDGVGPKTARLLWDHFESKDSILKATVKQLQSIPGIGPKKAEQLVDVFKKEACMNDKS